MDLMDFSYPMMDFSKSGSGSSQAALWSFDGVVGMMDFLKEKPFILYRGIADSISVVFSLHNSTTPSLPFAQWSSEALLMTIRYNKWLISLGRDVETCSIPYANNESNANHVGGKPLVFTPLSKLQSPQVHHTSPSQWSLNGHCSGVRPNTLQRMQCMQQHLGGSL